MVLFTKCPQWMLENVHYSYLCHTTYLRNRVIYWTKFVLTYFYSMYFISLTCYICSPQLGIHLCTDEQYIGSSNVCCWQWQKTNIFILNVNALRLMTINILLAVCQLKLGSCCHRTLLNNLNMRSGCWGAAGIRNNFIGHRCVVSQSGSYHVQLALTVSVTGHLERMLISVINSPGSPTSKRNNTGDERHACWGSAVANVNVDALYYSGFPIVSHVNDAVQYGQTHRLLVKAFILSNCSWKRRNGFCISIEPFHL